MMMRLAILILVFVCALPLHTAWAQTYDNSCSGGTNSGTSTSCTMTIGTLTNGVLYIAIADTYTGADSMTTPTVGGSSTGVTLVASRSQDPSQYYFKVYRLLNPPSGSQNIAFTDASASLAIAAISYSGVDQTTPDRTPGTARGFSTSLSTSATTVSGDIVPSFFAWLASSGVRTLSYDASQTSRQNRSTNDQGIGISDETASGSSTTASGTLSGDTTVWAVIEVPMIAASSSTPRKGNLMGVLP